MFWAIVKIMISRFWSVGGVGISRRFSYKQAKMFCWSWVWRPRRWGLVPEPWYSDQFTLILSWLLWIYLPKTENMSSNFVWLAAFWMDDNQRRKKLDRSVTLTIALLLCYKITQCLEKWLYKYQWIFIFYLFKYAHHPFTLISVSQKDGHQHFRFTQVRCFENLTLTLCIGWVRGRCQGPFKYTELWFSYWL